MMAISRNPNEYAFVHAQEPDGGRWLSPKMLMALGIAGALHIGLIVYLYNQNFNTAAIDEPRDLPPVVITTQKWPKTPPAPLPTHPVVPHRPTTIDTTQTVTTTTFPPQPTTVVPDEHPALIDSGPARAPIQIIGNPNWVSQPTPGQLARYYPARALDEGVSGRAVLMCAVTAAGSLTGCSVVSETSAGAGFGQAALKLSSFFRISPRTENGRPVDGAQVRIPLEFSAG